MAQHTPAPWSLSGQFFIKAENGWVVAEVRKPKGRGKEYVEEFPYAQANARLIAAAPDGLELAEDAIPILEAVLEDREDAWGHEDEILRDLLDRTRAFVARATGQA